MNIAISEIYIIIGVILGIITIVGIAVKLNGRLNSIESEIYTKPPIRERLTFIETKINETHKSTQTLKESHDELNEKYWKLKTFMVGQNLTLKLLMKEWLKK